MEVVDVPEPGPAAPGLRRRAPGGRRPVRLRLPLLPRRHGIGARRRALPARAGPRVLGDRRGGRARLPARARGGQRVAVWPVIECGTCHACRIGRGNACERDQPDRHPHRRRAAGAPRRPGEPGVPGPGTGREADRVRRADVDRRPAVGAGRVAAGERVLVLGAGPIGQALAIAAIDRGRRGAGRRPSRGAARARAGLGRRFRAGRARRRSRCARAQWAGGELPEVVFEATGARSRCASRSTPSPRRAASWSSASRPTRCRFASAPCRFASSTCSARAAARRPTSPRRPRSSRAGARAVEPLLHEFSLEEAPAAIAFAIEHPAEVMKAVVHTG